MPTFEDIDVGSEWVLKKGSITTAHLVRWCGATENWHRIHYDHPFATKHDGLPGVLVNGSWKQHVLIQLLTQMIGPSGSIYRIQFRYVAMDVADTTITAKGVVAAKSIVEELGFVRVNLEILNGVGIVSTTGAALVVLPIVSGPSVPYPFPNKASFRELQI